MTNHTHVRKYAGTVDYGRGRSLIPRTTVEKDARRGAQMYAAAMRGELKSYIENEPNHNAR